MGAEKRIELGSQLETRSSIKEENLAGGAKGKLLTTGSKRKEKDDGANWIRLREEGEIMVALLASLEERRRRNRGAMTESKQGISRSPNGGR